MRPSHLSRLRIPGGDVLDLSLLHAEWALGLGRFERLRTRRTRQGVPEELTPADIAGDRMRISLPLRDGTRRTSVVRLVRREGLVVAEHLVVREGDALRHPTAAVPEVVAYLLANELALAGDRLRGSVDRIVEEDVEQLVARILDPSRREPMVLVSVDNATRLPLLDPDELARRLTGMMSVHFIATVRASRLLKEQLLACGYSDKFGCYNGGVRVLWPGIQPGDDPYDHLLLLPLRLTGLASRSRAEQVAGVFCEMAAEDEDLRAWLREVDASGRPPMARRSSPAGAARQASAPMPNVAPPWATMREHAEPARPVTSAASPILGDVRLTQPQPREPSQVATLDPLPAPEPPPTHVVAALDFVERESATPVLEEESPQLAGAPLAAPSRDHAASDHWMRIAEDVKTALELAAELEDDLDRAHKELALTRKALRRAEQERDELRASIGAPQTVAGALARIEGSFPKRVVILPSAHASGQDSPYRNPIEVLEVISILAMFGRNDRDLHEALARALGNAACWRAKDSRETTARFGHTRTWPSSSGAPKLYQKHITLGGSVNASRCLQIYYDVLDDGRVEVAWCGEHRPTVSRDT